MVKPTKFQHKLLVPLTSDLAKRLKKISESEGISMNQLARFGIENILKKYEKKALPKQ